MITIPASYASQLAGVDISSIPSATFVKTDWDAGSHDLTGYIYGGTLFELETAVPSSSNLTTFKAAAIAAIEADFLERFATRAELRAIDFTIAVDGLNVVANNLSAAISYLPNEEPTTQLKALFALAFDSNTLVLAVLTEGVFTDSVPAATTLLAQQGRQPLQIG